MGLRERWQLGEMHKEPLAQLLVMNRVVSEV